LEREIMETQNKTSLHPLVVGAAGAVLIVSAVAVAAITGYLPGSNAKAPESTIVSKPAKPTARNKICKECGVVLQVKEVDVPGKGTGVGAVAGGVAGAVIGHEIGENRAGTAVGAVVGGVAGHQIERQARMYKRYDIAVRMHDGSVKQLSMTTQPAWRAGDMVRVRDGAIKPI